MPCLLFPVLKFLCSQGLPCHLYFDLEFNKRVNIGKNGDEMVDLLIAVVLKALHEKYAVHGDRDWIVELDSSTEGMSFLHVFCICCKLLLSNLSITICLLLMRRFFQLLTVDMNS